ncbi:MAG: SGNH/GDSL hydrolase family protein [Candidatus Eiseniibacteriota bacterium]
MARRWLLGAAGLLATTAVTLVFLELALRLYSRITPNADVEFVRYAHAMKAAAPGSGMRFRHAAGSRHRLFGVDVQIDSRGFRDVEGGRDDGDAASVVLLGDSVTFGWGVSYGERFSEILEAEWSAGGRPVELINTGHGNWNTAQEYAALEELFAGRSPDAILQVWYINDAEPTPEHRDPPWYARFHLAVFAWSKFDLLERRFGARPSYVDYYRDLYASGAPGLAAFDDALLRTGAWASARGVPWAFVVLPEFHEFPGPFAEVYERVKRAAAAAGATVIDLTGAFDGVDPSTVWVARNDVHPNAKGHALIARGILQRLDAAWLRRGA